MSCNYCLYVNTFIGQPSLFSPNDPPESVGEYSTWLENRYKAILPPGPECSGLFNAISGLAYRSQASGNPILVIGPYAQAAADFIAERVPTDIEIQVLEEATDGE